MYASAGADVIFFESPETEDEMEEINKAIKTPTLANMVEGGRTPLLSAKELEKMGYSIVIFPTASVYATARAMTELMQEIKEKGSTKESLERMIPFSEFNELIGLTKVESWEKKYLKGGL